MEFRYNIKSFWKTHNNCIARKQAAHQQEAIVPFYVWLKMKLEIGEREWQQEVDDFSRFTWVNFIKEKSDTFEVFKELSLRLQREKDCVIKRIRSDHGRGFL